MLADSANGSIASQIHHSALGSRDWETGDRPSL